MSALLMHTLHNTDAALWGFKAFVGGQFVIDFTTRWMYVSHTFMGQKM